MSTTIYAEGRTSANKQEPVKYRGRSSFLGYDLGHKEYDVDVSKPKFRSITVELTDGTSVVVSARYNAFTTPTDSKPNLTDMALEFQKVAAVLANIDGIELPRLPETRVPNLDPWWKIRSTISPRAIRYRLFGAPKAP